MNSQKALLALLASSSTKREFQLVPYGAPPPTAAAGQDRPTISCDGRIEGVTLELTHWTGNKTPQHLYADTSTEIALKFIAETSQQEDPLYDNALILNNHYDSDGALSCWACLEPNQAMKYQDLMVEGAAAGDFGEWSSEAGMKLNFSLENMKGSTEEVMYAKAFESLPSLLEDIQNNNGNKHEHLWKDGLELAQKSYNDYQAGKIRLTRGPGKMVIVEEGSDATPIDCHALHRALVEENLWKDTTRILLASAGGSQKHFRYQMPGHGWVQRLMNRPPIPAANAESLVQQLNSKHGTNVWTSKVSGLSGICKTITAIEASSKEVAVLLHSLDEGAAKASWFAKTFTN